MNIELVAGAIQRNKCAILYSPMYTYQCIRNPITQQETANKRTTERNDQTKKAVNIV